MNLPSNAAGFDSPARLIDAIAFAAEVHRMQRRKDIEASPYINHPLALLRILAVEAGITDTDVLCAAALHDYLEDCCGGASPTTLGQGRALLRERFGATVLDYVEAVTDDKMLDKAQRKRLQVDNAGRKPHGARLVKLADKIANLRDILGAPPAHWNLQRRQDYFDWAAQVVAPMRGTHSKLEALFDAEFARRPDAAAA